MTFISLSRRHVLHPFNNEDSPIAHDKSAYAGEVVDHPACNMDTFPLLVASYQRHLSIPAPLIPVYELFVDDTSILDANDYNFGSLDSGLSLSLFSVEEKFRWTSFKH